jgi:hypothetical protein
LEIADKKAADRLPKNDIYIIYKERLQTGRDEQTAFFD